MKKENIERTAALRDFVSKHPDSGNLFSKFTRRFEARRHINQYKKAQEQERALLLKNRLNSLRSER